MMPNRALLVRPLVLLADDFEDARELYRDYLGVLRLQRRDGQQRPEAIDRAIATQPDLILMDASMPVLDGWQATRALQGQSTTKHIPIIALTAHASDDARQQAKAVGCDGFVTKPCLPDDLVTSVRARWTSPEERREAGSSDPAVDWVFGPGIRATIQPPTSNLLL